MKTLNGHCEHGEHPDYCLACTKSELSKAREENKRLKKYEAWILENRYSHPYKCTGNDGLKCDCGLDELLKGEQNEIQKKTSSH